MLFNADLQNITQLSEYVKNSLNPEMRMMRGIMKYSQSIVGDYKVCVRADDHLGWVICDGRYLDRTNYKALFDLIGTSFGTSSSDNFRIPDYRGKVLGALNISSNRNNSLSIRNLGDNIGSETHTLTVNEIPSHNHGVTDPGHTHGGDTYNVGVQSTDNAFGTEQAADETQTSGNVNSATTGITINNTGGGLPHNNMQPTLFGGNVYIFAGLVP